MAEWCSESSVSLLGSSRSTQWRVNVQGEPKEPIRRCSSVTYWRGSSPSAWFNGAILFVIQPWIDTLDGYQFFGCPNPERNAWLWQSLIDLSSSDYWREEGFNWGAYVTVNAHVIVSCSASIVLLSLFVPSVCIYVMSGGVKNISNHHMSFVPLLFFSFPFPRTAKPDSPVMVTVQSAEAY